MGIASMTTKTTIQPDTINSTIVRQKSSRLVTGRIGIFLLAVMTLVTTQHLPVKRRMRTQWRRPIAELDPHVSLLRFNRQLLTIRQDDPLDLLLTVLALSHHTTP